MISVVFDFIVKFYKHFIYRGNSKWIAYNILALMYEYIEQ